MWGRYNQGEYPMLRSYTDAANREASIKPIRGRAYECKPLGPRRKDHVNIRKDTNGNIVVRMWNTDIITYCPDGEVLVSGYTSLTTHQVLRTILGVGVYAHRGSSYINCFFDPEYTKQRGTDTNNVIYGALPLPSGELSHFEFIDNRLVNMRPTFPEKQRVNRKAANAARKPYKDFIKYAEGVVKLRRDTPFTDEEFREFGISLSVMGVMPYMLSSDPEDNFRALLVVARDHFLSDWRRAIRWPYIYGNYDPVKAVRRHINGLILLASPEVYYYEEVRTGKLP